MQKARVNLQTNELDILQANAWSASCTKENYDSSIVTSSHV